MSGEKPLFSMGNLPAIALTVSLLSLVSSGFQSWNYARNIESVQRNVLRAENLRTCKEIIGVFFQLRLNSGEANHSAAGGLSKTEFEAGFAKIDGIFSELNDDCVKSAQSRLL